MRVSGYLKRLDTGQIIWLELELEYLSTLKLQDGTDDSTR